MQTLTYSTRSRYTLAPTRDVGAFRAQLDKFKGKARRAPIRADSRAYPKFKPGDSTADYVRAYEALNGCRNLRAIKWQTLNVEPCTLYSGEDAHQSLPDEFATWAEFDAAQSEAPDLLDSAQSAVNDPGAPVKAADQTPTDAPAPIRSADVAPPGYAIPDPLATHPDTLAEIKPGPVADMVAECRAKVAGDPRPQFGLRLQAAKRRAIAQGMRDGIAARAANPETLAAWAINAPTNDAAADALDTLADAMPAPPAPTRAHVEHSFDAWRAEPDEYRGHVIECYGAARAQIEAAGGYPYNADAWPLAAAMMADRYGYPDARESGASDGVARAFGSHCYSAGCVLDARRKRERERTAAARFIPGQIIGRATWNDGKLCTGIMLQTVSADGAECRLTGKRAGRGFEWTCDAYSLQCAIERAAERAGLLAERRKHAKPTPVEPPATHTAPAAEHYSAGAGRADAIGNHRRAEVLREIAAEESGTDPVPTHSEPAPSADPLPQDTGPDDAKPRRSRSTMHAPKRQPCRYALIDGSGEIVNWSTGIGGRNKLRRQAAEYSEHPGAPFTVRKATREECDAWSDAKRHARHEDSGPTAQPVPGDSAPVARLEHSMRIVQTLLDAMRRATPGIAPAASALRSEAARVQRTGEDMRNGAPQYAADCRMAASALRDMAEHAEATRAATGAAIIAQDLTLDEAASLCAHVDGGGSVDAWVKPGSPIDDDTAPAPLDGLDVADLGADGLAEFERAGGTLPEPTAPAYSDAQRPPGPSLRIPATDPRARIPARFAPVYCLRA